MDSGDNILDFYDEAPTGETINQVTAESEIRKICTPAPIAAIEVTAKNWAVAFDTSKVTSLTPANSWVLTLWYRNPIKGNASLWQESWATRVLFGVERWKYRQHNEIINSDGEKVLQFDQIIRSVVEISVDENLDLYHSVFGADAPVTNEPIVLLFKLGKEGRPLPGGAIQYVPTPGSNDPITSKLSEKQLQTWLSKYGVPDPDNANLMVADLELARVQQPGDEPKPEKRHP
jgi:hypothetical protein